MASVGIDVVSSCSELVKTERTVVKESMSDGDDDLKTVRGKMMNEASTCNRARGVSRKPMKGLVDGRTQLCSGTGGEPVLSVSFITSPLHAEIECRSWYNSV